MYIVKVDGEWVGYRQHEYNVGEKFKSIEGTQDELKTTCENYSRETILQISFAENFDKFSAFII